MTCFVSKPSRITWVEFSINTRYQRTFCVSEPLTLVPTKYQVSGMYFIWLMSSPKWLMRSHTLATSSPEHRCEVPVDVVYLIDQNTEAHNHLIFLE